IPVIGLKPSTVSALDPPVQPTVSVPPRLGLPAEGVDVEDPDEPQASRSVPTLTAPTTPAVPSRNLRRDSFSSNGLLVIGGRLWVWKIRPIRAPVTAGSSCPEPGPSAG